MKYNGFVEPTSDMDELALLYVKIKKQGLLGYLCYESVPDLANFLAYVLRPGSACLAWRLQGIDGDFSSTTLAGMAHVTSPVDIGNGHLKSEIMFVFLREFQGGDIPKEAAIEMLRWVFERTYIDSLHGYTAAKNRAATRFAKSVGFVQARLPDYTTWKGDLCDSVVSSFTRKMWELRRHTLVD